MRRARKKRLSTIWKRTQEKLHKNGNHITQPYAVCSWINWASVSLSLSLSFSLLVCVCSLRRGCYLFIRFFLFLRLLQWNAQAIISHRLLCARIVRSINHEFMNKQIVSDGPTSIISMHRISLYFLGSFDASYDNYHCHHRLQSLFLIHFSSQLFLLWIVFFSSS